MVLKQQLHQRQVQKLILAPALQQAIKLLPLTNLELIEIIDEELSQNPMLEVQEETTIEKSQDSESESTDWEHSGQNIPERESSRKSDDDREVESYFQEYFDEGFRSYSIEKKEAPILENYVSKSTTLWDHLDWQANLTFFEKQSKEIAEFIIGNINDDGYLMISLEEISEELEISLEKIEEIREKIMRFDPVGVASLTLKESLLVQMETLELNDEITRTIVEKHLSLLEKSDFLQLSKELNLSMSKVKEHIEVLKHLDPTPGLKYSREKTFYVVPDIIVTKESGEFKITLNDEGIPRIRINSYYKRMLNKASKDDVEAIKFLKDRMKKAFWFLRSLDQRNNTIYKVAKFIVEKQSDFLEKGLDYIKPLTLIELAQDIGVHESTVGRVVTNKYMMTPRGVFPLKYFFHKALSGDFGEEISTLRIKERMKKLVDNEEKDSPLSDIEIGEILAKENFGIARRTVAKYRKQLSIPPSHIRKRRYWMEDS
jgi:RNA polymerase sigma-54 factor